MRLTILKDKKITEEEVNELQRQFDDLFDEFDVQYFVHERDYDFYPTYKDNDGDERPTTKFLWQETDFVKDKYGKWGTDHVAILIHEDNWRSDPPGKGGIWGTNWSNIYHGYQVHYCRFDRDNMANSLGTFYHEHMHSFDALIKTELGINIAPFINVSNWDKDVVHGGHPHYKYIRYNENLDALDYITSYLKKSYAQRKARFDQEYMGLQKSVILLLQKLVVLLRQQTNRKNGVNKLCSKHTQQHS